MSMNMTNNLELTEKDLEKVTGGDGEQNEYKYMFESGDMVFYTSNGTPINCVVVEQKYTNDINDNVKIHKMSPGFVGALIGGNEDMMISNFLDLYYSYGGMLTHYSK